ncbi:g1034 [Coccomyxa viridis]|uniref:G1034 protein n=1 Tax=Coccomyxa viridis TaxID=1274662 RepID=A0ABP1FKV5_9CHLO
MEGLFATSEARVITAYKVIKCNPSTTSAWTKKKQPKATGKERVICLTAERRSKRRGFKGSIHTCKPAGQGTYQVRKSWSLKHLTRLEAFPSNRPDGRPLAVELLFGGNAFSNEAKLACEAHTPSELMDLMGTLYLFAKKHEGRVFQVVGVDVKELERWGLSQAGNDLSLEGVGAFGAALLGDEEPAEVEAAFESAREGGGGSLVSAKEERDLAALLDLFALGVGDVEEFQERLQAELAALEAANVHAILEGGPMVASTVQRTGEAARAVDDLAETLAIFDLKLRHMREDIAAIEARNNRLERQARHNAALMDSLERLLERLVLPEQTERILNTSTFNYGMVPTLAEAGWDVWERLAALEPADPSRGTTGAGQLEAGLSEMSAVLEQRNRLQAVSRRWVERAGQFVTDELIHLADGVSMQNTVHSASRLQLPVHTAFHERAEALAPLLQVIQAMKPNALPPLADRYCTAINGLLRRELHAYTTELKRSAVARMASSAPEPDIVKGARKEALMPAQALHRRLSSVDSSAHAGDGSELLPHTALRRCLDAWVPLLIDECDFAAAFLLLYKPMDEVPGAGQDAFAGAGRPSMDKSHSTLERTSSVFEEGEEEDQPQEDSAPALPAPILTPEGSRQLSALMDGVVHDFMGMMEMVSKQHQLLAMPMLAEVLSWQGRVMHEPVAAPVANVLEKCAERLALLFTRYIQDMVLAVSRYDGRGTISLQDSVKSQHILPFFPNFVAWARRLETLLVGTDAEAEGVPETARHAAQLRTHSRSNSSESMRRLDDLRVDSFQQPPSWQEEGSYIERRGTLDDIDYMSDEEEGSPHDVSGSDTTRGASHAGRQGPAESVARRLQMEEGAGAVLPSQGSWGGPGGSQAASRSGSRSPTRSSRREGHVSSAAASARALGRAGMPERLPSPEDVTSVRDLVNASYAVVIRAMFAQLERMAGPDVKHGDRLRLENYTLLETELPALANKVPVLGFFVQAATAAKEAAMGIYVQQQLEYGKLWKLVEFSQRIDTLLEAVEVEEVAFQAGCQAAELRAVLATALAQPQRKLSNMHSRIHKHLGATAPKLAAEVWERLRKELMKRYVQLEEQMAMCYPSLQLVPSPQEMEAMCKAAAAAG